MAKYRKKPLEIEAELISVLLNKAKNNWADLPYWVRENYENGNIVFLYDSLRIRTLEGTITGELSDYLIQGVSNEIYPCKPDIFEKTYELVHKGYDSEHDEMD